MEYPPPSCNGRLLRDCITRLYQHWFYHCIERHQLLGKRFYHLLILHHYRLLGSETHPRRTSPATTMVARTMGSRNQHRLAPLPHTHLVFLFLAINEPSDPADHELGSAHVWKHYHSLSSLLHCQGKTRLYRTGCADEEKFVEAGVGALLMLFRVWQHLLEQVKEIRRLSLRNKQQWFLFHQMQVKLHTPFSTSAGSWTGM